MDPASERSAWCRLYTKRFLIAAAMHRNFFKKFD
jgi:hypothetical protein